MKIIGYNIGELYVIVEDIQKVMYTNINNLLKLLIMLGHFMLVKKTTRYNKYHPKNYLSRKFKSNPCPGFKILNTEEEFPSPGFKILNTEEEILAKIARKFLIMTDLFALDNPRSELGIFFGFYKQLWHCSLLGFLKKKLKKSPDLSNQQYIF
ncbi:hypothetical protein BpHYR1_008386 [Brachionus plicatilis]|uniref:Uncharacterized protein n=1 Tax=Brachionus plicatilis TaxID=10195 RepID=A0A3M7RCT2_BRAPC|nr:hypothetical protein BpHYR1_008386 [Brachionus plicatilis]